MDKSFINDIQIEKFIKIRQDLHRIPELKGTEYQTKQFILDTISTFPNKELMKIVNRDTTGLTVDVSGQSSVVKITGPLLISIRADMDGLPIVEETGVEYTSTHKGVMHACGHDGHMAIIMATLESFLSDISIYPSNFTVRFLFQPSEESGGGAEKMIKAGVLEGVDEIYGLHNTQAIGLNSIGCIAGPNLARIDIFNVCFTGKEKTDISKVLWAANLAYESISTIKSTEVDSKLNLVISIGDCNTNSDLKTVTFEGTVRCFTNDLGKYIQSRFNDIAQAIEDIFANEIKCNLQYNIVAPPLVNDAMLSDIVTSVASTKFKVDNSDLPCMFSDDFAFYTEKIKGCYYGLGGKDQDHNQNAHTSKYNYNDLSTENGVFMFKKIINMRAGL